MSERDLLAAICQQAIEDATAPDPAPFSRLARKIERSRIKTPAQRRRFRQSNTKSAYKSRKKSEREIVKLKAESSRWLRHHSSQILDFLDIDHQSFSDRLDRMGIPPC